MKTFSTCLAGGLASLSLLAGCDNSSAISAENFEKALELYYDSHPVCISLAVELPLATASDVDDVTRRQLDALASVGLLTKTQAPGPVQLTTGSARHAGYSVAAASKEWIRKGADKFMGGTDICFAYRHVLKVQNFTSPAELAGTTVSRVTYDYDLKDVAPWVSDSSIQAAFPRIKALVATPVETDADGLVLTGDRWLDERALR